MALGGSRDRSGRISTTILTRIVAEFKLTLDIEALVEMADEDKSGWGAAVPWLQACERCQGLTMHRLPHHSFVDFEEFKAMLTAPSSDELPRQFP